MIKINWFSPLPPSRTAIGTFTLDLFASLSQVFDIVLFTSSENAVEQFLQKDKIIYFDSASSKDLYSALERRKDALNIYNIGDNPLHTEILQASQRFPGLIILHDLTIGYLVGNKGLLKKLIFMALSAGKKQFTKKQLHAVKELVKSTKATGVLVHSQIAQNLLKDNIPLPLYHLPLPCKSKLSIIDKSPSLPYKIILFGYHGFSKKLHVFLKAFSKFEEKEKFELHIYGFMSRKYKLFIDFLIKKLNLQKYISFHGFVPEKNLNEALLNADLSINLHNFTTGPSYTQLKIWDAGLPSLVSKTGAFSEHAEEGVFFIDTRDEVTEICKGLREFISDQERFKKMGMLGKNTLENKHSPKKYAENLKSIILDLAGSKLLF